MNFAWRKLTACIQNSSCVPTTTAKSLSFFIVTFLNDTGDFWDQRHSRNFYNQVCTNTKKLYYSLYIALFLINVGVFLFRKNYNRNTPEPTKNMAELTEKPIKTHCKPCKNCLWHKKTIKNKHHERDFAKLRCLTVFSFFFKQNDQ